MKSKIIVILLLFLCLDPCFSITSHPRDLPAFGAMTQPEFEKMLKNAETRKLLYQSLLDAEEDNSSTDILNKITNLLGNTHPLVKAFQKIFNIQSQDDASASGGGSPASGGGSSGSTGGGNNNNSSSGSVTQGCSPGFFLSGSTCTVCPINQYSSTGQGPCLACPASFHAKVGQAICTDCATGFIGATPSCTACAQGKYAATSTSCSDCPAGTFSGAAQNDVCTDCTPGKYSTAAATACTNCDAGKYSTAPKAVSCTDCEAGKYSVAGSTSCTVCPAGKYSSNPGAISADACQPCPAGAYSNAGASVCQTCGAGTFTASNSCQSCQPGKYAVAGGGASCTDCTAGKYSTSSAASSPDACIACPAGTYSTKVAAALLTDCQACDAGKFSSVVGGTSCQACDVGKVATPGSSICTACAAGKFPNAQNSDCQNCASGTYSVGGLATCSACPAGKTSSDGGACAACVAGKYGAFAPPSATSCTACDAGKYSAEGAASCTACVAGQFSLAGVAACTACDAGKFSLAGVAACTACDAGKFSLASATVCTACVAGTFSATGSGSCTNCDAGKFSPASATVCTACAAGTFSASAASSCTDCPAGKYGLDGASCTACPAGKFSGAVRATTDVCQNCPVGKFASGTGKTLCDQCPDGTMSAGGVVSACSECTTKQVSNHPTNSQCTDCPSGQYADKGDNTCKVSPVDAVITIGSISIFLLSYYYMYAHPPQGKEVPSWIKYIFLVVAVIAPLIYAGVAVMGSAGHIMTAVILALVIVFQFISIFMGTLDRKKICMSKSECLEKFFDGEETNLAELNMEIHFKECVGNEPAQCLCKGTGCQCKHTFTKQETDEAKLPPNSSGSDWKTCEDKDKCKCDDDKHGFFNSDKNYFCEGDESTYTCKCREDKKDPKKCSCKSGFVYDITTTKSCLKCDCNSGLKLYTCDAATKKQCFCDLKHEMMVNVVKYRSDCECAKSSLAKFYDNDNEVKCIEKTEKDKECEGKCNADPTLSALSPTEKAEIHFECTEKKQCSKTYTCKDQDKLHKRFNPSTHKCECKADYHLELDKCIPNKCLEKCEGWENHEFAQVNCQENAIQGTLTNRKTSKCTCKTPHDILAKSYPTACKCTDTNKSYFKDGKCVPQCEKPEDKIIVWGADALYCATTKWEKSHFMPEAQVDRKGQCEGPSCKCVNGYFYRTDTKKCHPCVPNPCISNDYFKGTPVFLANPIDCTKGQSEIWGHCKNDPATPGICKGRYSGEYCEDNCPLSQELTTGGECKAECQIKSSPTKKACCLCKSEGIKPTAAGLTCEDADADKIDPTPNVSCFVLLKHSKADLCEQNKSPVFGKDNKSIKCIDNTQISQLPSTDQFIKQCTSTSLQEKTFSSNNIICEGTSVVYFRQDVLGSQMKTITAAKITKGIVKYQQVTIDPQGSTYTLKGGVETKDCHVELTTTTTPPEHKMECEGLSEKLGAAVTGTDLAAYSDFLPPQPPQPQQPPQQQPQQPPPQPQKFQAKLVEISTSLN